MSAAARSSAGPCDSDSTSSLDRLLPVQPVARSASREHQPGPDWHRPVRCRQAAGREPEVAGLPRASDLRRRRNGQHRCPEPAEFRPRLGDHQSPVESRRSRRPRSCGPGSRRRHSRRPKPLRVFALRVTIPGAPERPSAAGAPPPRVSRGKPASGRACGARALDTRSPGLAGQRPARAPGSVTPAIKEDGRWPCPNRLPAAASASISTST